MPAARDHGMNELAKQHLNHTCIAYEDVAGKGRTHIGFARVPIDKATEYAAEDADVTLRLWRVLKPRLTAEAHEHRLRDARAAFGAGACAHGAARDLDRPRHSFAALGRIRPRHRAARGRDQGTCGRELQSRQCEAARRYPVRQDAAARRHQDLDRGLVDEGERARGACRGRPRAAAENSRVAAADEAPFHLHGRAARSSSTPRPIAYIRPTRSRRRRPDAFHPPIRICRTSRSVPKKAARSAAPSSPRRA